GTATVGADAGTATAGAGPASERLWRLKELGFSDAQIARALGKTEAAVRAVRLANGVRPAYKLVDTCAGEFEAHTPYFYSTYERVSESRRDSRPSIVILGAGPNRIGQGLEFDYCCVQAAIAAREMGYAVAMVNCNPETVSTDYDISDRLYFEPLTLEDVLHIVEVEKPVGVIVQFGGQTPLKLAMALKQAGVPILGTSPESIHMAEDREAFQRLLNELGLKQAPGVTVHSVEEAKVAARKLGYPVLVRPSYVLGGRAMEIVYHEEHLERYVAAAAAVDPAQPILIDAYLQGAIELDVDAVCDGVRVTIGGILEHVEEAGVHSGDSACSLPATRLPAAVAEEVCRQVTVLAKALKVVGLMNVQFAWTGDELYVLEVNPRASRTVPFVSKAVGVPLAQVATRVMLGAPLDLPPRLPEPKGEVAVKEVVFPFVKFDGVDPVLGPEMRSTGEVMAWGKDLALAYWKAQAAAGSRLPDQGTVYLHAGPVRMESLLPAVRELKELGFDLVADAATSAYLESQGIATGIMDEAAAAQAIERGEIQLLVSLPDPGQTPRPGRALRERAIRFGVPLYTTGFGAHLAAQAITAWRKRGGWQVRSMQKRYKERARERAREMRRLSPHGLEPGGMSLVTPAAQEPLPGSQSSPKPA
ncbi:MAG: carbamoyl-phosphate synthase large subunit, partial [Limnochordales bacterium]